MKFEQNLNCSKNANKNDLNSEELFFQKMIKNLPNSNSSSVFCQIIVLNLINEIIKKKTHSELKEKGCKDLANLMVNLSSNLIELNFLKIPLFVETNPESYLKENEPFVNKMDNWNRGQIHTFEQKLKKEKLLKHKNSVCSIHRVSIPNFETRTNFKKKGKRTKQENLMVNFEKLKLNRKNKIEDKLRVEKTELKKKKNIVEKEKVEKNEVLNKIVKPQKISKVYDLFGNIIDLKNKKSSNLIPLLSISNTTVNLREKKIKEEIKKKISFRKATFKMKSKSLTVIEKVEEIHLSKFNPIDFDDLTNKFNLSEGVRIFGENNKPKECKFQAVVYDKKNKNFEKMTKTEYQKLTQNYTGKDKLKYTDSILGPKSIHNFESDKTITSKFSNVEEKKKENFLLKVKNIQPFKFLKKARENIENRHKAFEERRNNLSSQKGDINCFADYKTLFSREKKKKFLIKTNQEEKQKNNFAEIDEFNFKIIKNKEQLDKNLNFNKKVLPKIPVVNSKNYHSANKNNYRSFYNNFDILVKDFSQNQFI